MRKNVFCGGVIGIVLGMMVTGFSVTSSAEERIEEEESYFVAEDDTEEITMAVETVSFADAEPDLYPDDLIVDEEAVIASDETEAELLAAAADIEINDTVFPDPVFREYVGKQVDTDGNGFLSEEEINAVTNIGTMGGTKKYSSLKGIEIFTNLGSLTCNSQNLTSLDVSENKKLYFLECMGNQLTTLDVSQNTELTTLICAYNQLTDLNLGTISKLKLFQCHNNQLAVVDISRNANLERLDCQYNQLTKLDVTGNTALEWLDCGNNRLTNLDVSRNTALEKLFCYQNQLTDLEVESNTELVQLNCNDNQLTGLDLHNNTKLTLLQTQNNRLAALDVGRNVELTNLWCHNNQLTKLDICTNTRLESLRCEINSITILDISFSKNLIKAYMEGSWYSASGNNRHWSGNYALQYDSDVEIDNGIHCTAHQFQVEKEVMPSAYRDGSRTSRCTVCGRIKVEVISSTGNSSSITSGNQNASVQKTETPLRFAAIAVENITISKKLIIKKPSATKNKITVNWKHFKQNKKTKALWKKIKKVQVQCATDKGFSNIVKSTMVGKKKTKAVIKGLAKKTTYYVRVRYYDGTGYSAWSKVKKVKTK